MKCHDDASTLPRADCRRVGSQPAFGPGQGDRRRASLPVLRAVLLSRALRARNPGVPGGLKDSIRNVGSSPISSKSSVIREPLSRSEAEPDTHGPSGERAQRLAERRRAQHRAQGEMVFGVQEVLRSNADVDGQLRSRSAEDVADVYPPRRKQVDRSVVRSVTPVSRASGAVGIQAVRRRIGAGRDVVRRRASRRRDDGKHHVPGRVNVRETTGFRVY